MIASPSSHDRTNLPSRIPIALLGLAIVAISGAGALWYLGTTWLSLAVQLTAPLIAVGLLLFMPRRSARRRHIAIALPLLMLWTTLSLAWSAAPERDFGNLMLVVGTVALGAAAARFSVSTTARILYIVTATLAAISLLVAVLFPGIGQVEFLLYGSLVSRPVGVFGWNSSFGIVGAVAAVIAFSRWLTTKRISYLLAAIVFLGIVYFSQSATSTVATIAAALASAAITARRPVIVIGLAVTATAAAAFSGLATGALDGVFGALGRTSDLTGRTLVWQVALDQVWRSPFIGSGFGALPDASVIGFDLNHAHNGYIQILLEVGIIGAVLLLLVLLPTFLREVRRRDPITVGLLSLVLILNLANSYFLEPVIPFFIVAWLGFTNNEPSSKQALEHSRSFGGSQRSSFTNWI